MEGDVQDERVNREVGLKHPAESNLAIEVLLFEHDADGRVAIDPRPVDFGRRLRSVVELLEDTIQDLLCAAIVGAWHEGSVLPSARADDRR